MASRTATTSRNLYEEPFWRTTTAKIAGLLIVIVVGLLGIQKLERINARHQVESRLTRNPTLGPLLEKWRGIVETNQKTKPGPQDQLPIALYHGRVSEFAESKPTFGMAPGRLLQLAEPQLLCGVATKLDSPERVSISFKNQPANTPKPKVGEEWLVAVWRDSEGKNVLHTAYRCDSP